MKYYTETGKQIYNGNLHYKIYTFRLDKNRTP